MTAKEQKEFDRVKQELKDKVATIHELLDLLKRNGIEV